MKTYKSRELWWDSIEDLVLELTSVVKGEDKSKTEKEKSTVVFSKEISDTDKMIIKNAEEKGYTAYNIVVTLDKGCLLKGARAYLVVNKLEQKGEIIHTDPSAEKLEEGDFDYSFNLIYLSEQDVEEIKESIEDISKLRR